MKSVRQRAILDIRQSRDIDTQEQLLEELRAQGFTTTQATISRDIKELRLVKELTGTGSSVDVAQNIVVVRTMPGLASAACSALDNMEIDGVVGTLAGDDTGILIMRDSASAQQFNGEVHKLLR